jgi:glutaredoxin
MKMSEPTLELWQAEWCPESSRVRQRLTELGISFVARQIPADRDARTALEAATGQRSIPALTTDGDVFLGDTEILAFLDLQFAEPDGAAEHRARTRPE